MRVLEEPTAAAIAYGLHQKPNVHHILVYDFGGGAFCCIYLPFFFLKACCAIPPSHWLTDTHRTRPKRSTPHNAPGTLDVSLLYVHEGFVTVEGVDGDDHLGGQWFRGLSMHTFVRALFGSGE